MQFLSKAKILTEDGMEEIYPGECIITFSNTPALISPADETKCGFTNSYVIFDSDKSLSEAVRQYGVPISKIITETDFSSINNLLNRIYIEKALGQNMYREQIDLLVRELLIYLGRSASKSSAGAKFPKDRELINALQRVRREVYLNPQEFCTVN